MFLRKKHVSPARSSVRAVEGRQRTRYDRFETEAFIRVKRTCTYICIWSLKALGQRVLALLSGNSFYSSGHRDLNLWSTDPKINRVIERKMVFTLRVTVTLTYDLLTPKSNGFFNSIRAITLWRLKTLAQRLLKFLSGNGFHSSGHCDLDLWPTDPKINRGLLLNQGYQPMKTEGSVSMGTRGIERKRISLFGSLWPWPLTYWPPNQ